jgi:hypothetical protein
MTSGTTTTSKRNYLDYTALPETKASQYRLTQPTQKHTPQTLQELQQLTAIMQAADISGAQDIHVGMIQQILVKAVLLNSIQGHAATSTFWVDMEIKMQQQDQRIHLWTE